MNMSWCWPSMFLMVLLDVLSTSRTETVQEDDGASHTDSCDWTIWDDTKEQKGVRNVFGRCTEGHIDWRHPYGAVRVLLQLPTGLYPTPPPAHASTVTETCFRAKSHHALTKISLETDLSDNTGSSPSPSTSASSSSLLTSSQVSLTTLVILNQTHPHMERELCFTSPSSKPVGLFLEAQSDLHTTTSGHVEIDYDITRRFIKNREKLKQDDDMEECRPCTDAEILQQVCSSDFVVQGSISTVLHTPEAQESQVRVEVHKVHRQRHQVFKRSTNTDAASLSRHSQDAPVGDLDRKHDGEVIVPHKCGIKKGAGAFLFMGRMRLKRALLRCAPRLEDFEGLWDEAVRRGINPCTLD